MSFLLCLTFGSGFKVQGSRSGFVAFFIGAMLGSGILVTGYQS